MIATFDRVCPQCGTKHSFASIPQISGPRETDLGLLVRLVWSFADGLPARLEAYCPDCWFDIGAPQVIEPAS